MNKNNSLFFATPRMLLFLVPFAFLPYTLATPESIMEALPVHVPLIQRSSPAKDFVAKLPHIMDLTRLKYGFQPVNRKRSADSSPLTDEHNDNTYSVVVSIGTPAQQFNLVLDTGKSLTLSHLEKSHLCPGSSDLWVATDQCTACTSDIPLFDTTKSTSFKNGSSTVSITYEYGQVTGFVSQDTVTFSGFTATQQMLATATISSGLLSDGLSGIMGLGFGVLSSLPATPFWQSLYEQNQLSSPVFSFYIERQINQEAANTAPGGIFTLGGTNSSLYQGDIEFINVPTGSSPSYWLQQVSSITVQGRSISVSSSDGLAIIDTGSTLISVPSSLAEEIWGNVPGSVALSAEYAGTYSFPCNTSVSVSISFGGTNWPVAPADMNLGPISGNGTTAMCMGAISGVEYTTGSGAVTISWIIGVTFLKNVYTVYRANPAAVGFAQLANGLNANGSSGSSVTSTTQAPSPTASSSKSSAATGALHSSALAISLVVVVSFLSGVSLAL